MKEPEITLFGRKIVLPENGGVVSGDESSADSGGVVDSDSCLELSEGEIERADDERHVQAEEDKVAEEQPCETKPQAKEPQDNPMETSELDDNPKTPSIDEDTMSEDHPNTEQSDPTDAKQKTLKKPDKILPCPRCNSMETKFCYYNNYNVNQPRHFCKSCQRYWTAGGTMRNVPVGAGRRKNKNSASNCHHITISEALQAARVDNHLAFKPNGTVLSFGPDPNPSVFRPAVSGSDGVANGHRKIEKGDNGGDSSIGSFVAKPDSVCDGAKNGAAVMHNMNGFPCPVPCIPGVPWPFALNSPVPLPAICPPPGYPMPFYPMPFYPSPWNVPWLLTPSPTTANPKGANSSPNSPLGKHSRNGELIKPNDLEDKEQGETKENNSIVIPKTLRIDDPEEAAKSSIWETLGIKYDSISREGLFKALQPKGDEKKLMVSASPVLQANPAALSRSINFQEGA